ncbi:hypothetical protein JKP88DRAFT_289572 [Tribonema minus]|uniref:dUTP diphosphatase n=1 Tax=Tribonema minus TaxID=303371 RepID=A0A836CFY5_9STRA|nr:hypothetical protein JKP88DRAFT_289572 [Tribonema minus]
MATTECVNASHPDCVGGRSLSEINAHPRDARIQFQDEGHVYRVDGTSAGWISTTTLIHKLFPEFDSDAVIAKMMASKRWSASKYFGQSVEEIKQGWVDHAASAAELGTAMHADIERYYNNIAPENPECKEMDLFHAFRKAFPDLEPYRTEMTIFDEDVMICGSIDMIYRDPQEIKRSNFWEKGSHRLTRRFDSCNFIHYSLQLAIYKRLLQTRYDMKINGTYLLILHPSQDTFLRIETKDVDDVVEELFFERQQELEADANKENVAPNVKRLSSRATLPTRAVGAVGADLYSAHDAVIAAHDNALIHTDLRIQVPENTYGRVTAQRNLPLKNKLEVYAGVVDAGNCDDVCIVLFNHSDADYVLKQGDCVAQLIRQLEPDEAGDEVVDDLSVRRAVEIAEGVSYEEYIRSMRSTSTFGGGTEMELAARLFDLTIVVHGPGQNIMRIGEGLRAELDEQDGGLRI